MTKIWDRIMELPLAPLLLTIALSNGALAVVLMLTLIHTSDQTLVIGH